VRSGKRAVDDEGAMLTKFCRDWFSVNTTPCDSGIDGAPPIPLDLPPVSPPVPSDPAKFKPEMELLKPAAR